MSKRFPEVIRGVLTEKDWDEGLCGVATKCMFKLSQARALNIAHGYIHVDATGISITRRHDWREKAFMTRPILEAMFSFDQCKDKSNSYKDAYARGLTKVKLPMKYILRFTKTSRVYKADDERKAKINKARNGRRAELRAQGKKQKTYSLRKRIEGVAMALAVGDVA